MSSVTLSLARSRILGLEKCLFSTMTCILLENVRIVSCTFGFIFLDHVLMPKTMPTPYQRRCYFLPFHSIFCPSIPKIEEWKEIVILKLLFPSTFILILKIAISFHFYCYFLPFRNKRSGRK